MYEVAAHAPKICSVFLLPRMSLPRLLFRLSGPVSTVWSRRIEESERSVGTWKRQRSFLCDVLVLEP